MTTLGERGNNGSATTFFIASQSNLTTEFNIKNVTLQYNTLICRQIDNTLLTSNVLKITSITSIVPNCFVEERASQSK